MESVPHASRVDLPEVYRLRPDSQLLDWTVVEARLVSAFHYWICTVSSLMTPHPRPVDGMWMDQKLYFGGDRQSKWLRNLLANPAAAVHLEDPEHPIIAEGMVGHLRVDRELSERLVAASNAKYHMAQTVADYEGRPLNVFTPRVVLSWETLNEDATRFTFDH